MGTHVASPLGPPAKEYLAFKPWHRKILGLKKKSIMPPSSASQTIGFSEWDQKQMCFLQRQLCNPYEIPISEFLPQELKKRAISLK